MKTGVVNRNMRSAWKTLSARSGLAAMLLLLAAGAMKANAQTSAQSATAGSGAGEARGLQAPPSSPAPETGIVGIWQGTLTPPNAQKGIRLVIKVSKDPDGTYKATLYNADQGGPPLKFTTATVQGAAVTFTTPRLTVQGTMSADGKTIDGNFVGGAPNPLPISFARANADTAWAIPEPPKPMAANADPKFDVVTIKPSDPNRPGKLFTIRGRHVMTINTTVNDLITFGYSIQTNQMVNAPAWFDEKYDIDGVPDVEGQPNIRQMRILIRDALVERFGLKFHNEQRELSAYALTVAKGGPKLTITADQPSTPGNFIFRGLGRLMVTNSTMTDFCHGMQEAVMDKPVVDQTGLTDRYDFNLNWTPDQSQFAAMGANVPPPNTDDPNAPPSLYIALQEQLGLKLESTKAQVDVMVIDHVEKPSPN